MDQFNRFPSNGNPFGNFNAPSQQFLNQMKMNSYNFNQSFQQNTPIIDKFDFKNTKKTLHNNIDESVFAEAITEYQLFMDSNDRSLTAYQNPFKFSVIFAPSSRQTINGITYDSTPNPVISRKFKNIKYIKLDFIILPKTFKVVKEGNIFDTATTTDITNLRYVVLKVKEITNNHVFSTNNLSDCSFILYPDRDMGDNAKMWLSTCASRVFPNSLLGNLDRMTLEIYDDSNNLLEPIDQDNNKILFSQLENNTANLPTEALDSLRILNKKMGINVSFVLGVLESEINTMTKYE
jgi:hypothetical protein